MTTCPFEDIRVVATVLMIDSLLYLTGKTVAVAPEQRKSGFQKHLDAPLLAEFFLGERVLAYFEFAPTQSDQSSRVVDDAVKPAKAGVRIDPEELAKKTGYRLTGGE